MPHEKLTIGRRTAFAMLLIVVAIAGLAIIFRRAALAAKQSFQVDMTDWREKDDTVNDEHTDPFHGRRLRSFEREGITIPDRSIDSRECDDFENPRECNIADGYVGCFECVESRESIRVCAHVSEPVRVYDERTDRFFTLPANSSTSRGYCLRERLARDIRSSNSNDGDHRNDAAIDEARRACSAYNADWLLVRRRTGGDSSYNFACRCRYPHLMTNVAGPMSSCSKAVACNGKGRLDRESRESRADPFINGFCACDDGWIATRDDITGPSCREATFAEWPSVFMRKKSRTDLELYYGAIDGAFRRAIEYRRVDRFDEEGNERKIWLANPCGPCKLTRSPEGTYFCGDVVETNRFGDLVTAVHIGTRRPRDYLRRNGGRLPNGCMTFEGADIWSSRILVQYMSHSWNDGTLHAQEIGFFVRAKKVVNDVLPRYYRDNSNRQAFQELLRSPENREAVPPSNWFVAWTYNHYEMREHRAKVWKSLAQFSIIATRGTNLLYYAPKDTTWSDFAFYRNTLGIKQFFRVNAARLHDGLMTPEGRQAHLQWTYKCPDLRGLDSLKEALAGDTEITESEAERIVRRMLPICDVPQTADDRCYYRAELNANHDNPTACVMFDSEASVAVYAKLFWYPEDMNATQFVGTRNKSLEKRRCPGDS